MAIFYKNPPLVKITWLDARHDTDIWQPLDGFDFIKGSKIEQVGWLIGEDVDCINLATSRGEIDVPDDIRVSGVGVIPKRIIHEIVFLKEDEEPMYYSCSVGAKVTYSSVTRLNNGNSIIGFLQPDDYVIRD